MTQNKNMEKGVTKIQDEKHKFQKCEHFVPPPPEGVTRVNIPLILRNHNV